MTRSPLLSFFPFLCLGLVLLSAGVVLSIPQAPMSPPQPASFMNITFTVYEGTGCGCVPLRGVPINASGRDTDHNASALTDDNGQCTLALEYSKTYRISIEAPEFEHVLFDVLIVDHQQFAFHLKEVEVSVSHAPLASGLRAMLLATVAALREPSAAS